ncbi:MAG: cytochrome b/b6 domain-containing protein [bacterium]|nr:cytochrome b/b6 domain-containing protein [bacterium]
MPVADTPLYARIWDAPIRLFHWLLVALLAFSWWSGENHEMEWHRLSGYGILGLLIFRIYWGFVGGRTARFAQFLRGPRVALAYIRSLGTSTYDAAPGHNPVGGWSVLLMLVTLLVMVGAGLFAVDVDGLESGPLADYVSFDQGRLASDVHGIVFNFILALVALHVLAIFAYLLILRTNLISPMIHGRRRVKTPATIAPLHASPWKALVGIFIAAACTYAIAQGFRL